MILFFVSIIGVGLLIRKSIIFAALFLLSLLKECFLEVSEYSPENLKIVSLAL